MIRFNENDLNAANGIVKLDASGKLPALDGSLLTNVSAASATLDNDFDAYQVQVVNTDTTMTEGILYIVTASAIMSFGGGTENGDRIAILIPDDGITVTLKATGGSLGTGRRFCINGICYGDSVADSTMGATSNGTLNISGKGKCLEFVRHNDGIRTGWIEQSHTKYFDTAGGATEAGNWANFDRAFVTNAASGTDNRQTLVFNGTDWVWRKNAIDSKSYSRASDGGTLTLLPLAGYQYGDYEVNFLTTSSTNWTSGYVCNLQAYSAVERDAIHMKPLIFLIQDNKVAIDGVSPVNVWPNYLIRFIDNTVGVTFQQVADFDANGTYPYTQQSALGIRDPNYGTNHYLTYCGVVIMFDYDQQKWYRLRHLYRPT